MTDTPTHEEYLAKYRRWWPSENLWSRPCQLRHEWPYDCIARDKANAGEPVTPVICDTHRVWWTEPS